MATPTGGIPPDLTDADKASIFHFLDATLNSTILISLLSGIYTGITAVTVRNIFINKSHPIRQPMIIVIIMLYIGSIISFALIWSQLVFFHNGWNFWTTYLYYCNPNIELVVVQGGIGIACTILADAIMIWHCWMIWGQQWLVVLLPVLLFVSAIVFKSIGIYEAYINTNNESYVTYFTLYPSFILASTVLCTLLIIYRIITVAQRAAAGNGLRAYHHIIKILVESSALYSITLILYVAFFAHNDVIVYYFDHLAAFARGVALTLLVGQVAVGHTQPDDSWEGSVVSGSLQFGGHSSSQSSDQQDSMISVDLEAQQESYHDDEYGHQTVMDSQEGVVDESGNDSRQAGSSSMKHV
ncbi:uncharacterized protein EV420DRAFT_1759185 [Desarmillaria tabescens]|uniref:Uncharacterized protein n=1 Tax=Armillaria tabescens TaxID=1929756 RepID=A0AA39NHR9_ARMTA|nr:uncharacterized protein EV420DRAFT_1759185 [Desarmillaria tabescens]KAK0465864.1 hypothetical protein EV420DRAFT_1759185 [Desarmillaria tabescens]